MVERRCPLGSTQSALEGGQFDGDYIDAWNGLPDPLAAESLLEAPELL